MKRCQFDQSIKTDFALFAITLIVGLGLITVSARPVRAQPAVVATGAYPDIAVDSTGNIHLAYAYAGKLRYRMYDVTAESWSAEEDTGVAQLASYRNKPNIEIDSADRPHMVGGQSNGGGKYVYWDGASWTQIDAALNRDTSLAIDSQDNVYIIQRGGGNGGYLGIKRRSAGTDSFTTLTDPDIAGGLPLGRNDHVYGTVFINPVDDSVHAIYRHGAPLDASYRGSNDAGLNWFGGGVSGDDFEEPSGLASANGDIYVVTGNGTVYERTGTPSSWSSIGRGVTAGTRMLPVLAIDASGNLYSSCFGGKYNVYDGASWIGESTASSVTGAARGLMRVACGGSQCYAVWEEGSNVLAANDNIADDFDLVVAALEADGTLAGLGESGGAGPGYGTFDKWARIELPFSGPASTAGGTPNPFDITFDVLFSAPSGNTYAVPGFYDGDGNGNQNGNVWKIRFSADEIGAWSYSTTSTEPSLHGLTGTFSVTAAPANAPDFYRWGRLEYPGTAANELRYLKFRDGSYWLKAGCDDPENFLGSTVNYDTLAERKAAIDYLSSKGVNSFYIMSHNIGGDDQDVWPWLGATAAVAQSNSGTGARFDIPKLTEWLELFEHMQQRGVVLYLVLEDDSAWSGYDHPRYYRELIARFGHLPGLIFNFCEEANESYTLTNSLSHLGELDSIDPYGHPRGIHNVNTPEPAYVDAPEVHFTSIQTIDGTDPLAHNQMAIDWIDAAVSRGTRIPMVGFDEARPLLTRSGWWSAYIGGAVWEVHTDKPYDRPMSTWETAWTELGGARAFMETLPFWEMVPSNDLVQSGTAFCLAKPGDIYACYLPTGGSVTISLEAGNWYDFAWWDPQNDQSGALQDTGSVEGGQAAFTAPSSGDWALRVWQSDGPDVPPAPPQNLTVQ